MAITITSKYTPLSFEDKIKPMMLYKAEYDSMMDKYDKLEDEASKLAYIALQYPDSDAAKAYNLYISDLDAMATEMSLGLSSGYRRKYSDIYKRYGREITPMTLAYGRMMELQNKVLDLELKDPSIKFNFQPREVGIDSYANGNIPDLKYYSGNLIYLQSAKIFENLANDVRNNPDKWNTILGGQYFTKDQMTGYTSLEIFDIIQNNALGNEVFKSIYDDLVTSSGVKDWDGMYNENGELTLYGQSIMDDIYSNIGKGAWEAIGKLDTKYLSNQGYLAPSDGSGSDNSEEDIRYIYTPRQYVKSAEKLELNGYKSYESLKTLILNNPDIDIKKLRIDLNSLLNEARILSSTILSLEQLQHHESNTKALEKARKDYKENQIKIQKAQEVNRLLESLAKSLNFKLNIIKDNNNNTIDITFTDNNSNVTYTLNEFLIIAEEDLHQGNIVTDYVSNYTSGETTSSFVQRILPNITKKETEKINVRHAPSESNSKQGDIFSFEEYEEFKNALTSNSSETRIGTDSNGIFIEYTTSKDKKSSHKKAYINIEDFSDYDLSIHYNTYKKYKLLAEAIKPSREKDPKEKAKLQEQKEQLIKYYKLAYHNFWESLDFLINNKAKIQSKTDSSLE